MPIFDQAARFLSEHLACIPYVSENDKRYRFEHSMRVAGIAEHIAEAEGQDVFIVTIASILHDVGKYDEGDTVDHGRVSARIARSFLKKTDLTEKQIGDIAYCIAAHVDGDADFEYDHIPEADTVSEADNIDRFGVLRIYSTLRWMDADSMSASELAEALRKRIDLLEKYYNEGCSTKTATEMYRVNIRRQICFYRDLITELSL